MKIVLKSFMTEKANLWKLHSTSLVKHNIEILLKVSDNCQWLIIAWSAFTDYNITLYISKTENYLPHKLEIIT